MKKLRLLYKTILFMFLINASCLSGEKEILYDNESASTICSSLIYIPLELIEKIRINGDTVFFIINNDITLISYSEDGHDLYILN